MPVKKRLLVVEPGPQVFKEHILQALARTEWLELHGAYGRHERFDYSWSRQYFAGSLSFSYAEETLFEEVARYCEARDLAFDGVMTYVEPAVLDVNSLQHRLGLPVISSLTGHTIRNKWLVRRRVAELTALRQPWHFHANSEEALERVLGQEIEYPFVMKPTEFMGSVGVRLVRNADEARTFFPLCARADYWDEQLREKYSGLRAGVVCEQFVDGPQYSVETVVQNGAARVLGVTGKRAIEEECFTTTGHEFPARDLPEGALAQIENLVSESHAALGFRYTFTNTDIRFHQGVPVLMEVNPRLAGDFISEMLFRAFGPGFGQLIACVALGVEQDVPPCRSPHCGTWSADYATTRRQGRVRSVAAPVLRQVERFVSFVQPGDFLLSDEVSPLARLGCVLHPAAGPEGVEPPRPRYDIQEAVLTRQLDGGVWLAVMAASADDLEEMTRVERETWTEEHAATPEVMRLRLEANPSGSLVAYDAGSGRMLGFLSYVPLETFDPAEVRPWKHYAELAVSPEHFERLRRPRYFYGISLTVSPAAPVGTGTTIKQAAMRYCKAEGYEFMVSCVRAPRYRAWRERGATFAEYYRGLVEGRFQERAFHVCLKSGGEPIRYVENYFDDPESDNYSLLLMHDLSKSEF